jgi:TolB protein
MAHVARHAPQQRRAAACGLVSAVTMLLCVVAAGRDAAQTVSFVGYASDRVGAAVGLYVVRADGRGLRKVLDLPNGGDAPAWSPEGKRLAAQEGVGLVLLDASGKPLRRLTTSPSDRLSEWSPDGRWIGFLRMLASGSYFLAVRPDGAGLHQVTHALRRIEGFEWAPDSRRVLVRWSSGGGPRVGVVGASGALRTLVRSGCPAGASWAPDGREIAFASGCKHSGISVVSLATRRVRRLTRGNQLFDDAWPAWSPDGRRLAFSRIYPQGGSEPTTLNTIHSDGTRLRELEPLGAESYYDERPLWSPDGRFLLFERDSAVEPTGEYVQLAVLDVTSLDVRILFAPVVEGTRTWRRIS